MSNIEKKNEAQMLLSIKLEQQGMKVRMERLETKHSMAIAAFVIC
jgi:hypothetical protein